MLISKSKVELLDDIETLTILINSRYEGLKLSTKLCMKNEIRNMIKSFDRKDNYL